MIRAVLFDFFDVFHTDVYKSWLSRNNISHEGEYAKASHDQDIGHISNDQFYERLSELSGHKVTREELYTNAWIDHEMVKLAKQLREHYKIALISNAPSGRLRDILHEHNLGQLFDEIIISSEVNMVKPDPKIFHLALEKLTVEPDEAVFIDDNKKHVDAARELGITSIQFVSANQLYAELNRAGIVLS